MQYNFDTYVDRLPYNSTKWNMNSRAYQEGDLIPLWVADSDFTSPEAVKKAISDYAAHGFFGYTGNPTGLTAAVQNWMKRRHQWEIEESWLAFPGGVVASLFAAVRAFTEPGSKVIINDPVYPPFAASIRDQGREIAFNPLCFDGERFTLDYDNLKSLFRGPDKPKLMIFCSPHNATGRVWTPDELQKLAAILVENDCILISDEIHCDLVFDEHKHTTAGIISPQLLPKLIVAGSASKAFNVAGLHASFAIIPNDELRSRFLDQFKGSTQSNYIGKLALRACYTESDDYLEQVRDYITKNFDFVIEAINSRLAPLKAIRPEGTYLVWVDCRGLGLEQKELMRWLLEDMKLRLNDGSTFGPSGNGFIRLNCATPRFFLEEAVNRLEKGLKERS